MHYSTLSTVRVHMHVQNLDVNMAVNNLLSRDDDGERGDDSDSQNSYAAGELPPHFCCYCFCSSFDLLLRS